MKLDLISIILTNLVLVVGAVWRMGFLLSKIESRLGHVEDKLGIFNSEALRRISELEARVLYLERVESRP
jgi:Holliday junction resolvasome RuvABC ATP-dependent DNA helicase subunit